MFKFIESCNEVVSLFFTNFDNKQKKNGNPKLYI